MKIRNKKSIILFAVIVFFLTFSIYYVRKNISGMIPHLPEKMRSVLFTIGKINSLNNGKWIRSFRAADGTIYLRGHLKSTDGGKTVISQDNIDVEDINAKPEVAVFAKTELLYAVSGYAQLVTPGVYSVKSWRSTDNLKTIKNEESFVYVPGGPVRNRKKEEWYGLFVYRTIIEMPDGSWLMTMYGNFSEDTSPTQDRNAKKENPYMMRTFIVKSTDEGRTWHYLSSVAVPRSGDPVGEGFVEPAIAHLDDGRLLCIMRTGHYYPLYASWSADSGKTWTPPLYTGLDRACDPCLIKLYDGRLALSWGRRYPEGWSMITPQGDTSFFKYPGEGYTNLALSDDNGLTWINTKIAKKTGSCYSTIFEVEPNVIFFQVDEWYWRVTLKAN